MAREACTYTAIRRTHTRTPTNTHVYVHTHNTRLLGGGAHGERHVDGLGDLVGVVGVDDEGALEVRRAARELAVDQHAGGVEGGG
jgi:hypothetical protein